ncbi:MAG: ABC transporter substrate-binding protein [Deltaproteobacteria bacterium]
MSARPARARVRPAGEARRAGGGIPRKRGGCLPAAAVLAALLSAAALAVPPPDAAALPLKAQEEPAPAVQSSSDIEPVVRPTSRPPVGAPGALPGPAGAEGAAPVPALPLWRAESAYQAGRAADALAGFLALADDYRDDERKGFVWMRVADLLLAKGDAKQALDAADRAVRLSKARFLALSAMELKFRIYQKMRWRSEAREMASYLLSQKFLLSDPSDLYAEMARADGAEGRLARALAEYRQAAAAARDAAAAAKIQWERDVLVDGAANIAALREAGEAEEVPEVRAHIYLTLGNVAARKGFAGMAAFAYDKSARAGGPRGQEAAQNLFRLEKISAARPKIVGLLPLSGKYADIGFQVLSGAEVALRQLARPDGEAALPVLAWSDTGGQPDRARAQFLASSSDRSVLGFLGPLTGEEGHSVGVAFGPKSPPVLYLGQKGIPEKPYLYAFGLSPVQEARAVLSRLAAGGKTDLLLFFPDNGYGRGFSEAVIAAAREAGARVARTVSYPPDMTDFTSVIRKAAGEKTFARSARLKEKGVSMDVPFDAVVVADRWERVFLIASQLRYYNIYLPLAGFSGWNDEELIRKGGDAVAGAVFSVDYSDAIPGSLGEKFRREYRESLQAAPSRFEAMGFDGASLLALAFALGKWGDAAPPAASDEAKTGFSQAWQTGAFAAGPPAGELERERIPMLKRYDGVTGSFHFGPAGELRRKVSLMRVELGNFVAVPEP